MMLGPLRHIVIVRHQLRKPLYMSRLKFSVRKDLVFHKN